MVAPRDSMDVVGEPAIRGGNGRTDQEVEDASDIGFYLLCAGFVLLLFGAAWLVILWAA